MDDTLVIATSLCFPSAAVEGGEKIIHQTEYTAHDTDWLKKKFLQTTKIGIRFNQTLG